VWGTGTELTQCRHSPDRARPRLTVHLRINDAATGKPTPVRLRVTGPDGTTFAPFGRFAEFATGRNEDVGGHLMLGRERWCYIDGSCEVKLPAGVPLRLQATKGPEYTPLGETVTLGPGQMSLRLAIERRTDSRVEGWYSGDTRCHFLPPHAALLEAAAEDLDVVNLLACAQPLPSLDGTAYPSAPHLTAFSGQAAALESHGRLVAVNTLNAHPVLGKVGLLYSHRPVFPLAFGGDELDDWSVCDWCDQCHRKGGLTVWVDAFRPAGGLVGGEALVAAILGKIDAIEEDGRGRQPVLPWVYALWNAGIILPLVGGSGKDSNRIPLGRLRTYARLGPGEPLSYKSWINAVRGGRTFVTDGPLIDFEVDGRGPGEAVELTGTEVRVRASAQSPFALNGLELLWNGEVVAAGPEGFDLVLPVTESGWMAVRCLRTDGPGYAHTSPVVVRFRGNPPRPRAEAAAMLARAVESTREWGETVGRFDTPKTKQHLLDLCRQASDRLVAES
jgi:hypothetical protein